MKIVVSNFVHKIFIIISLLVNVVNPLNAQEKAIRFQHITTEDGLAQNMVDCILQDSQGFMWFGTWNGLSRYDGYKIEIFNSEDGNSHSLKNNFIYALREDQFGNILIGTKEGLYVYLYNKNEFKFIGDLIENPDALEGTISVISPLENNTFWVGTDKGVVHLRMLDSEGKMEELQTYVFGNTSDDLRGELVRAITPTNSGIWIGTDQGINIISSKKQNIRSLHHIPLDNNSLSSDGVYAIYQDSNNRIWVGTENGLNRYDPSKGFIRYFYQPFEPLSLPHNTITDIVESKDGRIFLATLGGLGEYLEGDNFRSYKSELKTEHSLNSDFINCLFSDKKGNLWIGTERGGVNIYNTTQNVLEFFEYDRGEKNSLSHNTINSIYEDEQSVWIGTAGGGLNKYDKDSRSYKHYLFDVHNDNSISSNFITAIHRDSRGRLWLATWGQGLNILVDDPIEGAIFLNNRNSEFFNKITNNFIAAIVEDSLGNLWIGTNGGLFKYVVQRNQFIRIADEINAVGCLAFDKNNNLWVGSPLGLYHLKFQGLQKDLDYSVINYKHDHLDETSLSGNYVTTILKDANGTMWFGTYGQGINRLSFIEDKAKFKSYSMEDGIANNIVYGILEDSNKRLWLSTDNGLTLFESETERTRNFYKTDGLLNNQYYWSAYYKNASGKLYFGGMSGLNTFYPSWISNRSIQPDVVITDLKIYNESVVPGAEYHGVTILKTDISNAKEIDLSYKSKAVAFEFSSLDYNEPDLIKYAYYLKGLEEDWNYVNSNRRFANYTNLKPGDYIFYVKTSDLNGEFTAPPTSIAIHIDPPFWETWWFRLTVVLFVTALVVGYNRYRIYNLKTQKLALERQVEERTKKINDQKHELLLRANQLKVTNQQLEKKQLLIKGQNEKLEHQNEHILQQRNKLIELNKKLKLVSQLKLSYFTNVSHEFRTPLTLIIGPLEGLLKKRDLDLDTKNTLGLINRNAQRLLHLINQILDFRRIEKGKMELKVAKDNINEFCHNIFNAFQPLAEIKNIRFNYIEDASLSQVWFDHHKIENIIYNLLSNAFKYTPENGTIKMEVKALSPAESKLPKDTLVIGGDKSIIGIKIYDSGIGISKENLPLVFKRFYRIDSEAVFQISGSGIGLTLADELIRAHHGNIFVESTLGLGSVFEIQFPCFKDAYDGHELLEKPCSNSTIDNQIQLLANEFELESNKSKPENSTQKIEKGRPVLLVVEDNPDLRRFLVTQLSDNYNVIEAEDGKKALSAAIERNPDIIVSDLMMPEMDGLELCSTIKNDIRTSHIPIILLTAKSDVRNRIEGLDKGADDYLTKPFSFELLEARIRNLIESRSHLRKLFLLQAEVDERKLATTVKDQKFLEQAIKIVENKMADPEFSVKDFVAAIGMSRSLLHQKLTALTDQSATEFINHFRLKKAVQLLKNTDKNISEVAYCVGYNDPKYFSRLFSKYYGATPKDYLQNLLKGVK